MVAVFSDDCCLVASFLEGEEEEEVVVVDAEEVEAVADAAGVFFIGELSIAAGAAC